MPSQSPSLPFGRIQACLHGRECVDLGQRANTWFYTYSSMLCPQRVKVHFCPYLYFYSIFTPRLQGRSYRGSGGGGGSDEPPPPPPPGPEKVRKNRSFFFFFWSRIAQESVFVEKDERTPPTENKSCKTRHAQVRMALRPNAVAAKGNQPYSSRPTCKTRRGQVRMPNAVLSGQ